MGQSGKSQSQGVGLISWQPKIFSEHVHAVPLEIFMDPAQNYTTCFSIDQCLSALAQSQQKRLMIWVTECWDLDKIDMFPVIEAIHNARPDIVWVFESSMQLRLKDRMPSSAFVIFVDVHVLSVFYQIFESATSQTNTKWNSDTNTFLFLTGKPNKRHRIGLLKKFYDAGLLDCCEWSLFMDENLRHKCRNFLQELSDDEYDTWINQHIRNPDSIKMLYGEGGTCHYDGFRYDSSMFSRNRFRVISETHDTRYIYPTEKTWITIVNRLPFLIAATAGTCEYLEQMGFDTFQSSVLVSYDMIEDTDQRLDTIVDNTRHWMKSMDMYKSDIESAVEHNYQHFLSVAKQQCSVLDSIKKYLSLPEDFDRYQLVPLYSTATYAHWSNWYQRVRDPAWPDCDTEEEFVNLPQWIQQECINVFGYKPKETT